jgi:pimeloyl-ACP methyl ester carboxylesterase
MPQLEHDGARLYYEIHGDGPPLIFAHGAGGNHLSWWQQVPAFRDRYTCVTFDHRGFGQSFDPRPIEERPRFDDDLAALIDHLGFEDVRLVAQSMGGWTCLAYTVRNHHRVRALVMADTAGGLTSPAIEEERTRAREALKSGLVGGALGTTYRAANPAGTFLYEQVSALNGQFQDNLRPNSPMTRIVTTEEEAAALDVPVLFIAGEEDVLIPPPILEIATAIVAGARLEHVPAAGHSVYWEQPGTFNQLVGDFLAEVDGARG